MHDTKYIYKMGSLPMIATSQDASHCAPVAWSILSRPASWHMSQEIQNQWLCLLFLVTVSSSKSLASRWHIARVTFILPVTFEITTANQLVLINQAWDGIHVISDCLIDQLIIVSKNIYVHTILSVWVICIRFFRECGKKYRSLVLRSLKLWSTPTITI